MASLLFFNTLLDVLIPGMYLSVVVVCFAMLVCSHWDIIFITANLNLMQNSDEQKFITYPFIAHLCLVSGSGLEIKAFLSSFLYLRYNTF